MTTKFDITPAPGSAAAVAQGCTCVANGPYGKDGFAGRVGPEEWKHAVVIMAGCPVHSRANTPDAMLMLDTKGVIDLMKRVDKL